MAEKVVLTDSMVQRIEVLLSDAERLLLDAEAARTGRSMSALVRDAITRTYATDRGMDADLAAIDVAFGAWGDVDIEGHELVERLRSGSRLGHSTCRSSGRGC